MSEQINKVLASTAQAFTTGEQLQARTNIDAQKSITFNYSGSNITALNGSAIAQSGAITEVVHDDNLSGSGTSASPLGLASEITLSSTRLPYVNTINSYSMYMHDASATSYVGLGTNYFKDSAGGETYIYSDHITINDAGDLSVSIHPTGIFIDEHNGGDEDLTIGNRSIVFSERDADSQVVDRSSIERWNSYSAGNWSESGNPLSTGFGGNQASAASQYNDTGNWAARTLKMSGLPDQTLYGFQSRPNGTALYGVNNAGAFVAVPQQKYFTYLFHETGAAVHTFDIEIFPTGLTADARLDFVNLCSAASANVKTDTFHGNTANIHPGESATMWYIATADIWTDGMNPVPV